MKTGNTKQNKDNALKAGGDSVQTVVRKRLVARAKRLLKDLECADLELSLISGGGQPTAVIHHYEQEIEDNSELTGCDDLGEVGVGSMIAL